MNRTVRPSGWFEDDDGVKRDALFEDFQFAPAPAVDGPLPGPRSRAMLAEQGRLESRARTYPRSLPIAMEAGLGATLRDVDGNTFIDFFAGAGVLNVGHSHPAVLQAAAQQQQRLVHALDFPTPAKSRLMQILRPLLPGQLAHSGIFHFGGPTGSDAVESAIKLAQFCTGRNGLVAFQGSYHGMTAGARSVSSDSGLPGPDVAHVHFLPYPYAYRSPIGSSEEACWQACAALLESCLTDPLSGVPMPAAVIVEPIQGEGGTIVPPSGFLSAVRRITSEHGVLLIIDEIQTGFGRTGNMFACEREQVSPDIVTLSKALGGIGYPLSCIAYDSRLDQWEPGAHIGTFRGHQVAMAAGATAIDFIVQAALPSRAMELGDRALNFLRLAAEDLPSIGDVRGRGLLIGIELVRDPFSKEPWPELAGGVLRACASRGLICEIGGHFGNVIRFLPPLTISQRLLDRGLEIFATSLREQEATTSPPTQVCP